jgi:hypothetical protein
MLIPYSSQNGFIYLKVISPYIPSVIDSEHKEITKKGLDSEHKEITNDYPNSKIPYTYVLGTLDMLDLFVHDKSDSAPAFSPCFLAHARKE